MAVWRGEWPTIFNNLLTIIRGYSELMVDQLPENDVMRNYVIQVDKAGQRAEALTRQLLTFSRKQIRQPKILSLNLLIRDMQSMMRRLIGEDLELRISLQSNLGNVQADPGQIQQLIMNLIVNSRDAIAGQGKIILETQNVVLDGQYVQKREMVKPGKYVLLAVSDTGEGIKKEIQDQIFEPFFTTKGEGKGTGLGLATVYGIVKQSEGYVWVYSEPGLGATFKVYLPRIDDEIPAATIEIEHPENLKGKETVLVVEDEEDVRELICETLRNFRYHVLAAANGKLAESMIETYHQQIHLLVTDVVMPQMGGRELAVKMSETHPETKVLFISGYTNNAIVHKGILDTKTLFLQKPFTPSELLKKIRRILDNKESP